MRELWFAAHLRIFCKINGVKSQDDESQALSYDSGL